MRPSFSAVSNNLGHLRLEPMTMENQERVNSKFPKKAYISIAKDEEGLKIINRCCCLYTFTLRPLF